VKTRNNLYERVASFANLYRAYRKVRRGKQNNRRFAEFNYNLEKNILTLKEELLAFTYTALPMRKRRIDDKAKKPLTPLTLKMSRVSRATTTKE
jgi:hypothetical protein